MRGVDLGAAHRNAAFPPASRAALLVRADALLERDAVRRAAFAALVALLIAPLLVVDIPPLLDYPNHLARAMVLAAGGSDPVLSRMYAPHWAIIPNLGLDLVLPALARVLPLDVAGRVVLAAALLLPVAGCFAYARAAFGRPSWWPFLSGLMAYNALFLLGFINLLIGFGLALLIGAAWLRWRDRQPAVVAAAAALGTTALFFVHVFGLLFLFALVGGEEAAMLLGPRPALPALLRRGAAALPAVAVPALLYRLAPLHEVGANPWWQPLRFKYIEFFEPFLSYFSPWELSAAPVALGLLYLAVRSGLLRARPAAVATGLVLLVLFLALPFRIKSATFVDARVPVMLGLLACCGLIGTPASRRSRPAALLALAALLVVRQAGIAEVWIEHRHDLAEFRRVIAPVRPGARVLVLTVPPDADPDHWRQVPRGRVLPMISRLDNHLAALLLIERRAFWPLLFTDPAKQPLRVLPPYADDAVEQGEPPDYRLLQAGQLPDGHAPYLDGWERRFDDVLVLNAGGADLHAWLPDQLRPLAAADVAALFEVRAAAP